MRDDEIRGRLGEVNPWWRAAVTQGEPCAWAADDRVLHNRAQYDLGYRADVLADLAEDPLDDRLVLLRGPRRVGKSVALKDTALALCRRPDVDPRQVIYLPADAMTARDLTRALVLGRELTRSVDTGGSAARRIWLLDEVTGIDDWTSTLKYQRDNTAFGDDAVVCTGSSWSDTGEVERDLLAGRSGSGASRRLRLLHPMRFRDVLRATRPDVPLPGTIDVWRLQSDEARDVVTQLELFADELDLAWQSYLTSGGFPRAVAEHTRTGLVGPAFLADLEAWLHRDVDRDGPLDSIPRLLAELQARCASPLNRSATAAALSYASRQNFDLRLNKLVRNFAGIWCHQVDETGVRVSGSQSKLYLADPLLSWLGHHLRSGTPSPDMTALSEAALAVHLAIAVDARQAGRWVNGDTIGYLRTGKGGEIDFAPVPVPTPAGAAHTTPIEGKWVTRKWRPEALATEHKFGGGVLATKNITDLSHRAWAVPAPVVALMLA
ncbi:AAA family ATPase [Actinoplanes sp. NPDC089786]|uniref:AAA family ATPase n=1 Tax=Actinoplanes sp. NPDC089786 TaxID=3155185 RepID=UPI003423552F